MGLASPGLRGMGLSRRPGSRHAGVRVERAAAIGLCGERGELSLEFLPRREVNDAQRALKEPGNVLHGWVGREVEPGLRARRIGLGHDSLAVGHQQMLAVRGHPHRRGIPTHRNEPERPALARPPHVKDRHDVVVGVRDKQCLLVRRQRQAVGGRTGRSLRIKRRPNGFQGMAGIRVQHGDGIAARVGDEQALAGAREHHLARMLLRRPACDDLPGFHINYRYRRLRPQADVKPLPSFIQPARVGKAVVPPGPIERGLLALGGRFGLEISRACDRRDGERRGIGGQQDVGNRCLGRKLDAGNPICPDIGDE